MVFLWLSLCASLAGDSARVVAVGDIMMHASTRRSALEADVLGPDGVSTNHGGYDALFAGIKEPIAAADLAFGNLETPIAPVTTIERPIFYFDAPASLAPALSDLGFDVLSFGNNHAYDQGPAGLVETLDHVEGAGMKVVGAGRTCAEAEAPVVVEVNGIRLAFLAVGQNTNIDENAGPDAPCVFWTGERCENSLPIATPPADWCERYDAIHFHIDEERVMRQVAAARQVADLVLLSVHYGVEYNTVPRDEFRESFERFVDGGVDVILGHHPHVLRAIERHTAPDGRQGLIAYSLGNLISNMGKGYDHVASSPGKGNTRDGAILSFEVFEEDGRHAVRDVSVIPVWTANNQASRTDGEPIVIRTMTHDYAAAHGIDPALLERRRGVIRSVVGDWLR